MLEANLKAVKCFRQAANKPFVDYYAADATLWGLLKEMEAKLLSRLGFEPDMVQVQIDKAIDENGPDSFVGIRQAAIYALMYWGTARFEEVKELELRQICKKGASLEIKILKGKKNQTRKLQRCVIHPIALHHQGRMCPVALIDSYLVHRNNLGHNSDHNYIFPQIGAKFEWVSPTYYVTIQIL